MITKIWHDVLSRVIAGVILALLATVWAVHFNWWPRLLSTYPIPVWLLLLIALIFLSFAFLLSRQNLSLSAAKERNRPDLEPKITKIDTLTVPPNPSLTLAFPLKCVRENVLSRRIHMTTRVDSSRCRSVRFVRWSWCQSPGKQPSQIIGNGRQRELGRHFGLSLGAELPHPPLLLQHSKHRFHQGLPFCVHSSSRRAAQLLPHRLQLWTAHPVASDGTRPFPGVQFACQVRVRHIHLDTTFF